MLIAFKNVKWHFPCQYKYNQCYNAQKCRFHLEYYKNNLTTSHSCNTQDEKSIFEGCCIIFVANQHI